MDELAINTFDLTRKKKKAKIDFVLNPNKASTSVTDNNKSSKAKVFKNLLKLELPEIVQKSEPFSVVKDLIETPVHITFGQLITHPQFKKNLCKSLIPKKKTPKTNKHSCQAELANNSNVTLLICKAQVAGYFINLILDSELSVNVIAKHFLEAIKRKIDEPSTWPMINIHGNKKKDLGIAKAVLVCINNISIKTDMKVSKAKKYIIINQEEEQSDKSDNDESNDEDQKEPEKTAEFAYIIFTSNGKPLGNVKANKEEIMVNGKLICWFYYNILKKTFDKKPGKKAKYKELKEVQKSFENKPPEIQSLVIEQREPSPKKKNGH
ncbi:hypothetical protein G9A89_013941 [Geosiphon pyriformis]|nr:hypothetical protein G9A89_013941 [Geosiphon pyriformis]